MRKRWQNTRSCPMRNFWPADTLENNPKGSLFKQHVPLTHVFNLERRFVKLSWTCSGGPYKVEIFKREWYCHCAKHGNTELQTDQASAQDLRWNRNLLWVIFVAHSVSVFVLMGTSNQLTAMILHNVIYLPLTKLIDSMLYGGYMTKIRRIYDKNEYNIRMLYILRDIPKMMFNQKWFLSQQPGWVNAIIFFPVFEHQTYYYYSQYWTSWYAIPHLEIARWGSSYVLRTLCRSAVQFGWGTNSLCIDIAYVYLVSREKSCRFNICMGIVVQVLIKWETYSIGDINALKFPGSIIQTIPSH